MPPGRLSPAARLALVTLSSTLCHAPVLANESYASLENKALRAEAMQDEKNALKFFERAEQSVPPGDSDGKVRILSHLASSYLEINKPDLADAKIQVLLDTAQKMPQGKVLGEYTLLSLSTLVDTYNNKSPWTDPKQQSLLNKKVHYMMALTDIIWKEKKTLVDRQIPHIRILCMQRQTGPAIACLKELAAKPYATADQKRYINCLIAALEYKRGNKAPLLQMEKAAAHGKDAFAIYANLTSALAWVGEFLASASLSDGWLKIMEKQAVKSHDEKFQIFSVHDSRAITFANLGKLDRFDSELELAIKALDGVPEYAGRQKKEIEFLANKYKDQKKTKELATLRKERHLDNAAVTEDWILDFEKKHLLKN